MPDQVKMTIVDPDGNEYSLWTMNGKTVWEALEVIGWDTVGACGGAGTCGKCKFRMTGAISEISPGEREHLMSEETRNGQRLACLTIIEGDFILRLDYWQTDARAKASLLRYRPGTVKPGGVSHKRFFIPGSLEGSPVPIYDRIKKALPGYRLELSIENLNYLAAFDRAGRPTLEMDAVIIDEEKVQYVGRKQERLLGLALDIGSTSLWAALLDMVTGETAALATHSNMQRIYGEDIISRVNYAIANEDGARALHLILINNLNSMIEEMLAETGAEPDNIYKVAAVGNPVMLHLLTGLCTNGFGSAPYTGIFSGTMEVPAAGLGLKTNPLSRMVIPPQLGGFVGADTTACLLTLTPYRDRAFLLIDIGTNSEIVLCHQGQMWAASAAAGPAFEGGALSCGMRAGSGAIDKVFMHQDKLSFRVIGGGAPRGICGSGIIDLVSVLLQNHWLDQNGIFTEQAQASLNMRSGDHGAELILAEGEKRGSGAPLVLNQDDVRQVQLAKAAVRTAIDILIQKANITASRIDHIFMAGAFGSYLDPNNVINIGLLPAGKEGKIRNIGNAAAEGAIMTLLSPAQLQAAVDIKTRVQYVELAHEPEFQTIFLNNLNF
ncbi:MAG: ASKHA domain-containing protein [Syntrophomonadaceae bacterium]|nr:ASKHA domain-containing protein [Syntrophomonadaceae bacterium]